MTLISDWASTHQMTTASRELKAVSIDSDAPASTLFNADGDIKTSDGTNRNCGLFDFRTWYGKSPLVYKPNFSSRYFFHNGCLFHWESGQRSSLCGNGYDSFVIIRCFSRSTESIKNLLHDVKSFVSTKESPTTSIYHSTGSLGQWTRQSVRPTRPMRTISLDDRCKARIVLDINEYLQPLTSRWYATRGIPYRRGYLFHGPPGTGKTSLSLALAGVFGLGLYCVRLSEKGLTESDLTRLFEHLPERCIVLLEDVDTAGIQRDSDSDNLLTALSMPGTPLARGEAQRKHTSKKSMINLAGLLNVIDGAASKEVSLAVATLLYRLKYIRVES